MDLYRKTVRLCPRPRHVLSRRRADRPVRLRAARRRPDGGRCTRLTEVIMRRLRDDVAELRGVPAPVRRAVPTGRAPGRAFPTATRREERMRPPCSAPAPGAPTFAKVLVDAGNDVTLWARRPELADAINASTANPDYLPGIDAAGRRCAPPPTPARRCDGADLVAFAIPSQTLRANLAGWAGRCSPRDATLVSLMKGIELGTTQADERGDRRGHRRRRRPRSRWCPGRTWPARSPRSSRPRPWSPAPTSDRGALRAAGLQRRRTSARTPTPTWSAASSAAR